MPEDKLKVPVLVVTPAPFNGLIVMLPVVDPPRARVLSDVVCNVPSPVKYVFTPTVEPEMEAVGVPLFTFKKANLAEAVEVPPTKASKVELPGYKAPLLRVQ